MSSVGGHLDLHLSGGGVRTMVGGGGMGLAHAALSHVCVGKRGDRRQQDHPQASTGPRITLLSVPFCSMFSFFLLPSLPLFSTKINENIAIPRWHNGVFVSSGVPAVVASLGVRVVSCGVTPPVAVAIYSVNVPGVPAVARVSALVSLMLWASPLLPASLLLLTCLIPLVFPPALAPMLLSGPLLFHLSLVLLLGLLLMYFYCYCFFPVFPAMAPLCCCCPPYFK
jgi:hypothetical protein